MADGERKYFIHHPDYFKFKGIGAPMKVLDDIAAEAYFDPNHFAEAHIGSHPKKYYKSKIGTPEYGWDIDIDQKLRDSDDEDFYKKILEGAPSDTGDKIRQVCDSLCEFLLEKNRRYGDSALHPINVYNKLDAEHALYVRADDKISRIKNNDTLRKNDHMDFMGYGILICIIKDWLNFEDQID